MKTTAFDYALLFTLKWEGGYVNDPNDPGGETNYGITRRTLELARQKGLVFKESVKDIDREDAAVIYRRFYWEPLKCDDMPLWVAVLVFDTGVNQGIRYAGLHLQSALNNLKHHGGAYFSLAEDGMIGDKTLSALRELSIHPLEVKQLFIRLYCVNRDIRYTELVGNNPKLKKFLKGWFFRTSSLQDYANSLMEV
ncbi:protein of unknown function DUF847 [Hydrogenobacter thermophilus TK-6]|uniref:Uncharacterized protein n=1 Tax=Hydrogenobacter thermophilus (strain DSM 6534 / IAM 12695 / TK-6) TaxID=608538 RepID=D3DGS3_HYDTT|nr:glycosyl hydrolase 108 family protein [Hydrogenobacter thermophilus]ADO44960.1 protein of unknown function DUF847 [Hydrogenobacter thermophilus TK-6]BAI69025.1 hypothetical protein HTH_0563 [Hydrogenobacter thermophilus TK-6]